MSRYVCFCEIEIDIENERGYASTYKSMSLSLSLPIFVAFYSPSYCLLIIFYCSFSFSLCSSFFDLQEQATLLSLLLADWKLKTLLREQETPHPHKNQP